MFLQRPEGGLLAPGAAQRHWMLDAMQSTAGTNDDELHYVGGTWWQRRNSIVLSSGRCKVRLECDIGHA
jgi:hypothetical protein